MKSVACIGQGFVGGSLTTVFAERGFDVYVYDKTGKVAPGGKNVYIPNADGMRTRQFLPKSSSEFARACEIEKNFSGVYFVCLPTPMYEDGSADLSIVEGVLRELAETPGRRIAVVKSTVPPGTTERWNAQFVGSGLRVIFNPEFLTEANALDDMRNQNRIILGGPRPHINTVKLMFQSAFPKVPLVKTSSTTAEMVKYVINCFLATKVAFANEVAQVCEALDDKGLNIDYDKVVEYAKLDTRLGNSHWAVPGPVPTHDGRYVRGFGGHCFPKDINALISISQDLGVDPKVMQAAWNKNLELRPKEDRDWEKLVGRAVSKKEIKLMNVEFEDVFNVLDVDHIYGTLWQGAAPPPGDSLATEGYHTLVLAAAENQNKDAYTGVDVICAPGDDDEREWRFAKFLPVWQAAADEVVVRLGKKQNVVVTCMAGLNRSGIISAMVLQKLTNWPGDKIINHIQSKRFGALCNRTFAAYIRETTGR